MRRILWLLLSMALCLGGCNMSNKKTENDLKREEMLIYAATKYGKEFEIYDFEPAVRGFNDGMNVTVLTLIEKDRGIIFNVQESVSNPDVFYDNFVDAIASYKAKDLIDFSVIKTENFAKTYIEVISEEDLEDALSKGNVFQAIVVICVKGKSNEELLSQLYDVYTQLQDTGYKSCYLDVAFTAGGEKFAEFVNNHAHNYVKGWEKFGEVYETLNVQEKGLAIDEFVKHLKERKK